VNGRTYAVSVQQINKDKLRVTLDDEVFESEPAGRGEISTWIVRSGGEAVRAQTKMGQSDRVDVWLGGMLFPSSVQAIGLGGPSVALERVSEKGIGGEIRALMPGRVTSILVKEGDSVGAGAPLLILEAMKMQNEIASPIEGRVKSIRIQEGTTVKKDSVLIEIV
jgi:biotin carboxyl carrier protein